MLFLWLVLGSRSRFTKLRGPLIAGDAPQVNVGGTHKDGLRTTLVLREALLHHFRACTRLTGFDVQDRSRGAPCGAYSSNRSFALRQCCPGTCPSDTRSQRLRQLVVGCHPITGAWLLDDAAQPV